MNNIYYHVGDADEIQAILRDGFSNGTAQIDGLLKRGVYIMGATGSTDPDYPNDQLLEITLPPEIDLRKWRIIFTLPGKNPCSWAEWIVPAKILNKHAKTRLLTKDQWVQTWARYKQSMTGQNEKTPDPEIIQQNAKSFETLAMKWMDSRTGKPANTKLRTAVLYMILDYFDCDNSADLYYSDLLAAVEEKLRLVAIKFGGLKGLPRKKELGQN
jgi:hypothetical protein